MGHRAFVRINSDMCYKKNPQIDSKVVSFYCCDCGYSRQQSSKEKMPEFMARVRVLMWEGDS